MLRARSLLPHTPALDSPAPLPSCLPSFLLSLPLTLRSSCLAPSPSRLLARSCSLSLSCSCGGGLQAAALKWAFDLLIVNTLTHPLVPLSFPPSFSLSLSLSPSQSPSLSSTYLLSASHASVASRSRIHIHLSDTRVHARTHARTLAIGIIAQSVARCTLASRRSSEART